MLLMHKVHVCPTCNEEAPDAVFTWRGSLPVRTCSKNHPVLSYWAGPRWLQFARGFRGAAIVLLCVFFMAQGYGYRTPVMVGAATFCLVTLVALTGNLVTAWRMRGRTGPVRLMAAAMMIDSMAGFLAFAAAVVAMIAFRLGLMR